MNDTPAITNVGFAWRWAATVVVAEAGEGGVDQLMFLGQYQRLASHKARRCAVAGIPAQIGEDVDAVQGGHLRMRRQSAPCTWPRNLAQRRV